MSRSLCFNCRALLPPDAPRGLCPVCLLELANQLPSTASASHFVPTLSETGVAPPAARFAAGDQLGPYRISRLLGLGGMGEVYEVFHEEHGRRYALKVLRAPLGRPEDIARFLHEAQIAASLDHANVVYVFSSEEIANTPVISMELLGGGTLADTVRTAGPFRPDAAVDAMLQVIAGLEAASTAGILHRDVKPSNCFVDTDGTVKVGDFGLSMPLRSASVVPGSSPGSFQGTPGFAAPEQVAGQALDVRSDIYAVGATLHYLLTGHAPGSSSDGSPVISATKGAPSVLPDGLDRVVARCLALRPETRFANYPDLVRALAPYRSNATRPAPPARRLAATLLDVTYLMPLNGLLLALSATLRNRGPVSAVVWALLVPYVLCSLVSEWKWGATLGFAQCGLRVVTMTGARPNWRRLVLRSAGGLVPVAAAVVATLAVNQLAVAPLALGLSAVAAFMLGTAVLWLPARRHGGGALLHDRLAGVRVVMPMPLQVRSGTISPGRSAPRSRALAQVGPFDVLTSIGPTDRGELFRGFEPRLRRHVWIHRRPAEGPGTLTDGVWSGPAALRWLCRGCSDGFVWDAYDEPGGAALLTLTRALSWPVVCRLLRDLAVELATEDRSGRAHEWRLDRLWLTADGRLTLVPFRPPGVVPASRCPSVQSLLCAAGLRLLAREPRPLPLSASTLLARLRSSRFATLDDVVAALTEAAAGPARLWRSGRLAALAVTAFSAMAGLSACHHLSATRPAVFAVLTWGLVAMCSALVWRGGFWFTTFGIALVTSDGREASRARAAARALIVWSWVPVQLVALFNGWTAVLLTTAVGKGVGLLWSVRHPSRGLQDRLAQTYLVPR